MPSALFPCYSLRPFPVVLLLNQHPFLPRSTLPQILCHRLTHAQRGFTLPPAATSSAKAARSAFFCALCQKGYTRMNELEAHQSSYDHQHKKRLKDMKEMQRQVQQPKKDKVEKGGPLMQIKLGSGGAKTGGGGGGGGGFKKGGFRNAFAPSGAEDGTKDETGDAEDFGAESGTIKTEEPIQDDDSDFTDEDDYYDPRKPTGCTPNCQSKVALGEV